MRMKRNVRKQICCFLTFIYIKVTSQVQVLDKVQVCGSWGIFLQGLQLKLGHLGAKAHFSLRNIFQKQWETRGEARGGDSRLYRTQHLVVCRAQGDRNSRTLVASQHMQPEAPGQRANTRGLATLSLHLWF